MREDVQPYPTIEQPRSILDPFLLGRASGDGVAGAVFQQDDAYVWGLRGSGKSVVLANIVAGGLQCTDCLVWVIGRHAAAPFLRAYGAGEVDRPAIDWVAPDLAEAADMVEAAREIAVARRKHYEDLKFQQNTTLLPVGDGMPGNPPPHIHIVVDHDVLAGDSKQARDVREALHWVSEIGRASAISIVYSGLRYTSDYVPPTRPAIRIGCRVTDHGELYAAFGQDTEPVWLPGAVQISSTSGRPAETAHGFYLDPKRMAEIGVQTVTWRPVLDFASRAAVGEVYIRRWSRTAGQLWTKPAPNASLYHGIV